MSLFDRKRREPEAAPSSAPAPSRPTARNTAQSSGPAQEKTHIAAGSRVVGEVSGASELVIDGQIEGHIELDSLVVVGEKGSVQGEIFARAVQVSGKVNGNIRGRERVEVRSSGRLEGDVIAPRVVIDDGAFFKGKVEMGNVDAPKKASPKADKGKHSSEKQRSSGGPPGKARPVGDNRKAAGAGK